MRDTWFLKFEKDGRIGIGEAAPLWGLSREPKESFEKRVRQFCETADADVGFPPNEMQDNPALKCAIETAQIDWETGGQKLLFESPFIRRETGIPINGLIWMGNSAFLRKQLAEKVARGFTVLKLKIGALDFEMELDILLFIRNEFSPDLEIRLDANGAFSSQEALEKLDRLAVFNIHSIEQPIRPGQVKEMQKICNASPIPVALDEELIAITDEKAKREMLDFISPAYIILKPSLLGGFRMSEKWIRMAESLKIGWWITSALESNIGLNAIAQWTASLGSNRTQGLGTGSLYTNNIPSPLTIIRNKLFYGTNPWCDLSGLTWKKG